MTFLFDPSVKAKISNASQGGVDTLYYEIGPEVTNGNQFTVFKNSGVRDSTGIRNYVQNTVHYGTRSDRNPYLQLIDDFATGPAYLKASDFTYLKELGLYPINRLIVLRRYAEGVEVPVNLAEMAKKAPEVRPISTVVGWTKPGDKDPLVSMSFNETWSTHSDRLDQVIASIADKEFNVNLEKAVSIPGWSQGFLFSFLRALGVSEEGLNGALLPFGDPNTLRETKSRSISGQNLQSTFSFRVESTYEQKFVGDVDPGAAMLDLIRNLTVMGTSDTVFILKNSPFFKEFMDAVRTNDPMAYIKVLVDFVTKMLGAIASTVGDYASDLVDKVGGANTKSQYAAKVEGMKLSNEDKEKAYKAYLESATTYEKGAVSLDQNNDANAEQRTTAWKKAADYYEKALAFKPDGGEAQNGLSRANDHLDSSAQSAGTTSKEGVGKKVTDGLKEVNVLKGLLETNVVRDYLQGTVGKYRWPLRAGIAVMNGMTMSPWHVTIGNPYSPFLSMNNIIVDSVTLDFSGELGFNDMPMEVKYTIQMSLARNLGGQEIRKLFNNGYKRIYSKSDQEFLQTP